MVVTIVFVFAFQKERKFQIILFDVSIFSLDIGMLSYISKHDLTFASL